MRDPNSKSDDLEEGQVPETSDHQQDDADHTTSDSKFVFSSFDSELDGYYPDEDLDEPFEQEDDPDNTDTHMVPEGLMGLQARLVSLGICNDKQWRAACRLAGDTADSHQVLLALMEIQNRNPNSRSHPPLTPYQVELIRVGCIDRLVVGHCTILTELYSDRTGTVYKVWNRNLSRVESLKLFAASSSADPNGSHETTAQRLRRVLSKIESLAQLNHHQITKVFHAGEYDGLPYIVTEYVEGTDLQTAVDSANAAGEMVPIWWAAAKVCEIASALSHAQSRGVVHQELTPRNIIIAPTGEAKILNLGLANLFNHSHRSTQTLNNELRAVLAPEHWLQPDAISPAADVYALGCILFFLITGRQVFEGTHDRLMTAHLHQTPPRVAEFRAQTPRKIDRILARMLAKLPSERLTCDEVIKELTPYCRADDRVQLLSRSLFRSAAMWVLSMVVGGIVTAALFLFTSPAFAPASRKPSPAVVDKSIADFYAKNVDVWASEVPLRAFVERSWTPEAGTSKLHNLMQAESWRRRWLLWLARHQQENREVWPDPQSLSVAANSFDISISSDSDFQKEKEKVHKLTRQRYEQAWDDWLQQRWAENRQIWPTVDDLRNEIADPVADPASFARARKAFQQLLEEKTANPFQPNALEDRTGPVGAMVCVYRWITGLPESKRLAELVDTRLIQDGKPISDLPYRQRAELQVRTQRPSYLTMIVFQATGRQLLVQTDLIQPGNWQPVFTVVSELRGVHEMLVVASDTPPLDLSRDRYNSITIASELSDPVLVAYELELQGVKQLEQRFVDKPAYDRTLAAVRRVQGLPNLHPLRPVMWYSSRKVDLVCK